MKTFTQHFFLVVMLSCLSLIWPETVLAGIDLPFSTTFDCDCDPVTPGDQDWLQYSDTLSCDGASKNLGSPNIYGYFTHIETAANYSGGGGGKGLRNFIGDGKNHGTGTVYYNFNTPQTEVWVRWYIRYESGFKWAYINGDKLLYFNMGQSDQFQPKFSGFDNVYFRIYYGTGDTPRDGDGWDTMYAAGADDGAGHKRSDGSWHCMEIHVKKETVGNTDGVAEFWIDGVLQTSNTGIAFGDAGNGWNNFILYSNQESPSNGGTCPYVDCDDLAVSNTGYIGPIPGGSADTISPSVSISSPTPGQTVSGNLAISASASDNVGVAGVQFKIDGNDVGAEDVTSPYSISQDTTVFSDGSHTLTATARDAAGNQATPSPVSVTISNGGGGGGEILFEESFEDASFSSRGWYDNINLQLSTTEHIPGSASSVEFHFGQGATTPTSGGAIRKKFTDTDTIYVSYYVKYSSNWEGSNKTYHPHEFLILTNLAGDWSNLAYTHLTAYIEQNEGEPLIGIHDGQNIDESNIGVDLTNITEQRSVAGCNGDSDGYGDGACYLAGSVHWNGKRWRAGSVYFQDTPGSYYKNDWHFIEAYIRLNSISNGIGIADGVIQYWYDGNLVIDHSDVVLRTGQHPNMRFNQFVIAPWIGDGSPVDQTFWVDNLTVATSRPSGSVPTIPTNFETK